MTAPDFLIVDITNIREELYNGSATSGNLVRSLGIIKELTVVATQGAYIPILGDTLSRYLLW